MTSIYTTDRRTRAGRMAGRVIPALSGAMFVLTLGACDSKRVLEVTDPDVAVPGSLAGVAGLAVVHAGAIGDFQVGYSGRDTDGNEGMLQVSALFSDEYINSETFPTRIEVDQRQVQEENATMTTVFRNIQRGRASADFASAKFAEFAPTDVRRAETMSLAGFAILSMAEVYCSGVPISKLTDAGAIEFGEPRTTAQLWDEAVAKFDSAITIASAAGASGSEQLNLARIGKGRALLNKGDFPGSATAVAAVPSDFVYLIRHSANTGRQNNSVFVFQRIARRFSATDVEGINGLPYRTDADPRVRETLAAVFGFDGTTPLWFVDLPPNDFAPEGKYQTRSAAVPLATGVEARLIEAEAALRANDLVTFMLKIDDERAAQGLGVGALPATTVDQQNFLFKERAYSMWFTGHRLGDLRRLIRQYSRGSETVFPTGAYLKGGAYGPDVNLIIPFDEKNNKLFAGCIDRNA